MKINDVITENQNSNTSDNFKQLVAAIGDSVATITGYGHNMLDAMERGPKWRSPEQIAGRRWAIPYSSGRRDYEVTVEVGLNNDGRIRLEIVTPKSRLNKHTTKEDPSVVLDTIQKTLRELGF
jgi:hypothetical protein